MWESTLKRTGVSDTVHPHHGGRPDECTQKYCYISRKEQRMTAVNRTFNVTQCCPLADLKVSTAANVVTWSCWGVAQEGQLVSTLD